jgi:hypothetical protein
MKMRAVLIAVALWGLYPSAHGQTDLPAKSILWPRFEVGQRVILRQMMRQPPNGAVAARVQVDVVGHEGDTFVLRWQVMKPETPVGLAGTELKRFEKLTENLKSPAIDLLIREKVGVIGVKNWEQARDETLALTERLVLEEAKGSGKNLDPERLKKVTEAMRSHMMNTRAATEVLLLNQIRPYFDGSYYEIHPGQERVEDVVTPWPFGGGDSRGIPAKRTIKLTAVDPRDADHLDFSIDISLDAEVLAKAARNGVEDVAKTLDPGKPLPEIRSMEVNIAFRWQFDQKRGWPTKVSSVKSQSTDGKRTTEEISWTLVTGPEIVKDAR